jgi:hypothetical protein
MATIKVDEETDRYLEFAAKIAGVTKGEVVARLVAASSVSAGPPSEQRVDTVAIHADYDGHRTNARFVPGPGRIEIADGPLAGKSYKTPSEAARAVVTHFRPEVSPQRNGWIFWVVTATGAPLQSIRHRGR